MTTESAIDLSMRSRSSSESASDRVDNVSIVRPIPRPPWSIIWYQNLWPSFGLQQPHHHHTAPQSSLSLNFQQKTSSPPQRDDYSDEEEEDCTRISASPENHPHHPSNTGSSSNNNNNSQWKKNNSDSNSLPSNTNLGSEQLMRERQSIFHRYLKGTFKDAAEVERIKSYDHDRDEGENNDGTNQIATIVDIACCDGPVRFERISNPNFALTVEHQRSPSPVTNSSKAPMNTPNAPSNTTNSINSSNNHSSSLRNTTGPTTREHSTLESTSRNSATKTYLCIYCNQSFKSLFCYQKHKKRHLNPVSVDITGINVNTLMVCTPENKVKTKDLNVQFFPCKKCGCKFPSYYFVHKHKKTCH